MRLPAHLRPTVLALCALVGCTAFWMTPARVDAVSLPDGRVFEMVTPPHNNNANVYSPYKGSREQSATYTYRPMEAAADGDKVAYVASPTVEGNESNGDSAGNEYLATRSPQGGWTQAVIQPNGFPSPIFQAFSSDLSVAIVGSHEALVPGALGGVPGRFGFDDLYRANTGGAPAYEPLITTAPPNRETERFKAAEVPDAGEDALAYAGASADHQRLLFEANDALTPQAEGGKEENFRFENNLYEFVDGQLRLVNVLPDGSTQAGATFGSQPPGEVGASGPDFDGVISADGSRVFWTDLHAGSDHEHVFARENGTSTVAISTGAAQFWAATPDGSYAFYTEGGALYRFAANDGGREQLADASGEVQGVIGVSEAGDHVYLVADGVLPGSQAGASQPVSGKPNLYLLRQSAGQWQAPVFIATLTLEDNDVGEYSYEQHGGDWQSNLGRRTAEVTPDGLGLVFMSKMSLTGYANEGLDEVYVYDAQTAALSCASCDPAAGATGGPGLVPISRNNTYEPRFISADGGEVFFESFAPLVPQDTNDRQDVYEWERDGSGLCATTAGCVYLLTGGTAPSESSLLDASANGSDVFVITRSQLLEQDENENYDLYDARVDGAVAQAPPECSGTGCQGVPNPPPVFATPSSVTFDGVGNFSPTTTQAQSTQKSKAKKPKPKRHRSKKKKRKSKMRSKHGNGSKQRSRTARRNASRAVGNESARGKAGR
jgi:hypothetical protein